MFYGWWIVIVCFFMGSYVAATVFWGFTAFFEPLVEEFKWSHAQVSFAISLRGLEMGILAPFVGFMADRYSPRRLLMLGIGCVGLGLVLLSQTTSLITFYAVMLLLAFGAGGCTSVVHMSLIVRWFKRRTGLALGIMGSGFGASGLAIPLIVHWVDTYGWRTTSIGLGLGMWLICLPLGLLLRDRPEDMGLHPDGDTDRGDTEPLPAKDAGTCQTSDVEAPAFSLKQSCLSASFIALFGAEAIRSLVISGVGLHIMPYLSFVGMDRSTAGLVAAGLPLLSVLGRFGFGYLGDKFDKRWIMALCLAMMSLGLLAYYPLEGLGLAVLFLLLFAPGLGGGMVLRASILSHCFNPSYFGRLIGLVMAAAAVGGILGPWLVGWYFDTFGDYRTLWLVFSGLILLSAILVRFIRPVQR
jgi:MFS family permease